MLSKFLLRSMAIVLLGFCLLSTTAFTQTKIAAPSAAPAAPESVLPYDRDAATKAIPQRTTVPQAPTTTCGACYTDDWTNKRRQCCTTGTTNCWVESCPIEIPDVLK